MPSYVTVSDTRQVLLSQSCGKLLLDVSPNWVQSKQTMKLASYLDINGMTDAEFARKIGVKPPYGRPIPDRQAVFRILICF